MSNLESLQLSEINLEQGIKSIAESNCMRHLRTLELKACQIGVEGALAIAESSNFKNLRTLNLYDNNIGAEGSLAIVTSSQLENLRELDLRSNKLEKESFDMIKLHSRALLKLEF